MAQLPKLLIIEDEDALRRLLVRSLSDPLIQIEEAATAAQAFEKLKKTNPDVLLLDLGLPDADGLDVLRQALQQRRQRAVIVLTGQAGEASVVEAMKLGAYDFLTKDTPLEMIAAKVASAFSSLEQGKEAQEQGLSAASKLPEGIVGKSAAMVEVFKQIGTLAPSSVPVLIKGESGTGKEKTALALHQWSSRAKGPFVAVDCASLPGNLLESELFGYEKGAFTGAVGAKKGKFEEADGGSLFLDEIGNVSLEVAAKLLRVIQEKVTQRLGSNKGIAVDVRILSATNADLWQKAAKGEFREDLIYRLAGAEVQLPPLRERPGDIENLSRHFLALNKDAGDSCLLSAEALALMKVYPWPGNVRELEHALNRAVAMSRAQTILAEHLPEKMLTASPLAKAGVQPARRPDDLASMEAIRRQYASYAVEICGGNRSEAAKRLEVDRRTLNTLLGESE